MLPFLRELKNCMLLISDRLGPYTIEMFMTTYSGLLDLEGGVCCGYRLGRSFAMGVLATSQVRLWRGPL